MKTADRILVTSLTLFNEEGESNVTSVDIANELDISPGNLYYHYRGKEEILAALLELFESRLRRSLSSPLELLESYSDYWAFICLLLSDVHEFRFLFRNPLELGQKYVKASRALKRQLKMIEQTLLRMLDQLGQRGQLILEGKQRALLARQAALLISQWSNFDQLVAQTQSSDEVIRQGGLAVMQLVSPFLSPEAKVMFELDQAQAKECQP